MATQVRVLKACTSIARSAAVAAGRAMQHGDGRWFQISSPDRSCLETPRDETLGDPCGDRTRSPELCWRLIPSCSSVHLGPVVFRLALHRHLIDSLTESHNVRGQIQRAIPPPVEQNNTNDSKSFKLAGCRRTGQARRAFQPRWFEALQQRKQL